ncbi:MAG: S46 family peptidase [Bacteroidetes bacterium]|nr:S46 family peptidase [Bacteroidota bacterium]
MKKLLLGLVLSLSLAFRGFSAVPDEGMWLPMFIDRLNYVDMQKMGLHLTSEELYSINNSSLKDAIISLGGFCTAEIVSDQGLLFTNHHCGYDAIQTHSTLEHDYLTNGFWAMDKNEELENKGLTASVLVRMEDLTEKINKELNDKMSVEERAAKIDQLKKKYKKDASEKGKYVVQVKDFFEGNEFYMFVYQEYKDIRLVGAPPSAVGKFGGDTDNWMWPRHTGDFSIFRIYTAPDGSPAEYSKSNIPLKPKHFLPISLDGVKKDDFTMIWGYPGTTDRFLTSYGVKLAVEESNPAVVKIRDEKLSIMKTDMDADPSVKLKYSSKYAQSANYWKYFIGQTRGLKRLDVFGKKKELEDAFTTWVNADAARKTKYGTALNDIAIGYDSLKKYNLSMKYLEEAAFQGPEVIFFTFGAYSLYNTLKTTPEGKEAIEAAANDFKAKLKDFFKDYNVATDKKLFASLMEMYYKDISKAQRPAIFETIENKYKGDFNKFSDALYSKSIFVDQVKLEAFLAKPSLKVLDKDLGFQTMLSMIKAYMDVYGKLGTVEEKINEGNRLFVAGLREMNPDKKYYPNANSTMRMTYGKVGDYFPADAVHYDYKTTVSGIIEKEDPKNDEFIVPSKLHDLILSKDYGQYADNEGKLNVCFITNTDITGGNSGSPVMNGYGQLIGLAFDGNWEAMSGDIAYEPDLQRTIAVDIRYVLFIIDKYAGASNLIKELSIVKKPVK